MPKSPAPSVPDRQLRLEGALDFSHLRERFSFRHGLTAPDWEKRALRWGTVNLTHGDFSASDSLEGDAPAFDASFWLDYARDCSLDAVSWSAGGIWATYPSELLHHPTLRGLRGDPLGDLVDGARKMGLVVTARVDHHAVTDEVAMLNPAWLARDFNGAPKAHWAAPGLFLTCALGPYNEHQMSDILCEIAARYGVDGFNHNRWAPQGMCYCASCQTQFLVFCGRELPAAPPDTAPDKALFSLGDPRDEAWKHYYAWRETRLLELWDVWNFAVRDINPHAFILPGIGAEAGKISLAKLRPRARTLYLDYQGRTGNNAPWSCGRGIKELRAALGEDKPVGITFTVGVEYGWPRWKDSTQTEAELRVWLAQAWAHDARPKWAKFDGRVSDARWMQSVAKIYEFAAQNARFLHHTRSLAPVSLLVSPSSARFGPPNDYERATRGWHQALIEARVPFDCVHEEFLGDLDPRKTRVLVLPDVSCLGDGALEGLRQFVQNGGNLLASHRSGICDEWGRERANWPLGELLGLRKTGFEGRLVNAYALVNASSAHPLLGALEAGAARPIGPTSRLKVEAARDDWEWQVSPLLLVPPFPDLPMEEVFAREKAREPLFWSRQDAQTGARLGYLAGNFDAAFWDYLCPDHRDFLVGALRWALGETPLPRVAGVGFLDVSLRRGTGENGDFLALHIVNMTNPFALRGPFRETFPVGPLEIEIPLPTDFSPQSARLLRAGKAVVFDVATQILRAQIERVEEHECLVIESAS